jgi:cytochrome c
MTRVVSVVLVVTFAACGPGASASPDEAATAAVDRPPERFGFGRPAEAAQIAAWDIDVRPDGQGLPPGQGSVSEGEAVYLRRCAQCHGPTGAEVPSLRLVGTQPWEDFPANRAVGNYWPYATTLYDYVVRAMPQDAPGSLTADETYAVIAYVLHRNEIVPADAVMDATTLPAVQMPARDRFVPDDRTGGPTIR